VPKVATETPQDLQQVIAARGAVIRIQRAGGPRRFNLDQPSLDVSVFASSLTAADQLCGQVCEAWLKQMPGALIDADEHGTAEVARVTLTSGPTQRPVADTTLRHVGATLAVVLRSVG
jgi:hypothetical protein